MKKEKQGKGLQSAVSGLDQGKRLLLTAYLRRGVQEHVPHPRPAFVSSPASLYLQAAIALCPGILGDLATLIHM